MALSHGSGTDTAAPRSADPIARRIRHRRLALGLSLQQLARRADLKSPSYIFHIENGHKIPSEEVAVRLATALGDDEALYRAWALALNRTDLDTTLSAAVLLHRMLGEPLPGEGPASGEALAWGAARLVVPVIAEGDDPGDALRPACPILERVRIDPGSRDWALPLERPFAWRVGAEGARADDPRLAPGALALFTRGHRAPSPDVPCAVRLGGPVVIARAWWNGTVLVLLPPRGERETLALDAGDRAELQRLVVGHFAGTLAEA